MDAAHATDLASRRSVTGYGICYAGSVVAYKSKLQATCSTSSTEAEFITAVTAAKAVKYLRAILEELQYPCNNPTTIHVDNEAAIAMVNEDRLLEIHYSGLSLQICLIVIRSPRGGSLAALISL